MEGINSSGRRVSLLNEDSTTETTFPPLKYSSSNSSSSPASSPGATSPQTPPLSRSGSSDSRDFSSPSPITPNMDFERASSRDHNSTNMRPHLESNSSFDYPPPQPYPLLQQRSQQKVPAYLQNGVPQLDHQFSMATKTSSKKNQYPCPVSKQYNCRDFFTTSGHAARHAKKHTGKKDAVCPECSKAFTRKDNMEQHRRTHSGSRGLATAATAKIQLEAARERKVRQQQQRRRSRSTNISTDFALDPQLQSPSSTTYSPMAEYDYQRPTHHVRPELRRSSQDESLSYSRMNAYLEDSRSASGSNYSIHSPSLAPALDALALAASRQ